MSDKEVFPSYKLQTSAVNSPDFNQLVESHYEGLYRFALSLSQREAEACDLTQQTFLRWATKGHQLRDVSKVKTWLYTTLHREFLSTRRHSTRFQHVEMEEADAELPSIEPNMVDAVDGNLVMEALMQVEELYRAPLTLFYLEDHSYQEIADILEVPIGTVMSRLARGKKQLKALLRDRDSAPARKVIPFEETERGSHG